MNHTPRLSLPLIHSSQAQKEITHNEALTMLDLLINPIVQEMAVEKPPDPTKEGEIIIIGENPQEEFTNHPHELALKLEHGWRFTKPIKWLEITLSSDGSKYRWNGENWIPSTQTIMSNESYASKIQPIPEPKASIENNMLINKKTGEYLKIGHLEEELALKGAYTDTTIKIPHHTIVIAVNVRVIKKITGTKSFSIGVSDDALRYGNNVSAEIDSTNIGLTNHPLAYWNDTAIRISAQDGSFTGGKIHISIQYLQPHGPWDWD